MFDLIGNLGLGFATALSPINLLLAFTGCLVGTLIGVLPGVGPIATIAMLLPLTFKVDPTGALIMLAGIYYGAQYGGSTTAILVNIPGEATSVVTTLDGHAMAKKGQAGIALGIAAIASFCAGTVATLVIAAIGAPLTKLALLFGPAEYFGLMVLGLGLAIVLARGSVLKAASWSYSGCCSRRSVRISRPARSVSRWDSMISRTESILPCWPWGCSALPRSCEILRARKRAMS